MIRRMLLIIIFLLIAVNTALYHFDPPFQKGLETFTDVLKLREKEQYASRLDIFDKIDHVLIEKNLDPRWIYSSKTDTLWFKRIRVPSKYTRSRYNIFFQRLIKRSDAVSFRAEEFEFSNKIVYRFDTGERIPAVVEIMISPRVDDGLKLTGNLSILITGFGDNWGAEWTKNILELPFDYSVSILPDRWASAKIYAHAVSSSKTVLINLPMEPERGNIDRERYRIMKGMNDFTIDFVVEKVFEQMPEAYGILNHRGEKVISDYDTVESFLRVLKRRGLVYIEKHEGRYSYSGLISEDTNLPFSEPYMFLEDLTSSSAQLNRITEKIINGDDVILLIKASEDNYNFLSSKAAGYFDFNDIVPIPEIVR